MGFGPCRRLQFFHQAMNYLGWNSLKAALILLQDHRQRWFEINQINPRVVIRAQINPTLTGLPHRVGRVEGKVPTGTQVFTARFPAHLNDRALISRGSTSLAIRRSSSDTTGRSGRFRASHVSLPEPGSPDMTVTVQR